MTPKKIETKTNEKSEKRHRSAKTFGVRVAAEELETVLVNAENTGLTPNALMRELALGYKPKSIIDNRAMRELLRLRGDLGRVGGLLKKHMNESQGKAPAFAVGLVRDIDVLKDEIREKIEQLEVTL